MPQCRKISRHDRLLPWSCILLWSYTFNGRYFYLQAWRSFTFRVQLLGRIIGSKTVQILMQVYDPIIQLVFRPFFAFRTTHVIFRSMNLLIFDRIIWMIL